MAMVPPNMLIALIGAGSAFGTSGAVLALMGIGAPFLLAALGVSACAGLLLYGVMPRPGPTALSYAAIQARVDAIEAQTASLRHDLRGVLSPALIVSDRLAVSADPAVRKAGEAVIRSIERASALIAASRPEDHPTVLPESKAVPSGRVAPPQPQLGRTAVPAPQPGVGP